MAEFDSDEEILQFAIAREIEAYNFYLALAERVQNPQIEKLFRDLAQEELEHKEKLELEVLKSGRTVSREPQGLIPAHEYIISNDDASLDIDYKDVLMLGMEKEEASFRTYINLLSNVDGEQSREVLLALAEEEVKHKLRFENEYQTLHKES